MGSIEITGGTGWTRLQLAEQMGKDPSDVDVARRQDELMSEMRRQLAEKRGVSLDELHTGHVATSQAAEVVALPTVEVMPEDAA